MNTELILNIVFVALSLIAGCLATYYKGNGKIVAVVTKYITESESIYTDAGSGGLKMTYVCGKLYGLLPAVVRPFIPQSVIQTLVQNIFNSVDAFAKKQMDKVTGIVADDSVSADAIAVVTDGDKTNKNYTGNIPLPSGETLTVENGVIKEKSAATPQQAA